MNKFRNTKLHRLERRNQKSIELHELANDPKRLKERVGWAVYILSVIFGTSLIIMLINLIF